MHTDSLEDALVMSRTARSHVCEHHAQLAMSVNQMETYQDQQAKRPAVALALGTCLCAQQNVRELTSCVCPFSIVSTRRLPFNLLMRGV